MATVNEDSVGVYVCTPTNHFGTMGSSGPTKVLLQVGDSLVDDDDDDVKSSQVRSILFV